MVDKERTLRQQAYKIVTWQLIVAAMSVLLAEIFFGKTFAISVLLGAFVAILSNVSFARTLFSLKGAGIAKKFVKAFFRAELYKILMTIVLTFAAIKWANADFLPFMIGYSVCYLVFWFSPLILKTNKLVKL